MIRLPKEDGAWWMGLTCWIVGWAAAFRLAWEPLAVALAGTGVMAAAQYLRAARRLWGPDRKAARNSIFTALALLLLPAAGGAVIAWRAWDPVWLAAIALPGAFYAPFLFAGAERRPAARILAVVALTGITPATYAAAAGRFGAEAAILWASLGGYFLLGSIFVMARLRRSAAALWVVRAAVILAVAATAAFAHAIVACAFALLAARVWSYRPTDQPVDPKRVGNAELGFAAAAALFILAGIWVA